MRLTKHAPVDMISGRTEDNGVSAGRWMDQIEPFNCQTPCTARRFEDK
jgi:hypothetical protein